MLREPALRKDVEDLVRKHGVTFKADETLVKVFTALDASDELLRLLPRPEPPKPKVAGPLTIRCQPLDCHVVVDEKYHGLTAKGTRVISGHAPGEIPVFVFMDGYEEQGRRITLEEEKPHQIDFTLRPNLTSRRRAGRDRIFEVIQSLGGPSGLGDLRMFFASGTLQLPSEIGPASQWKVMMLQESTALAMSFESGGTRCTAVQIGGGGVKLECKRKLSSAGIAEELRKAVALFREYQLPSILSLVYLRNIEIVRSGAVEKLECAGGDDVYELTLSDQQLPLEVQHRRKSDQGKGMKLVFSHYKNLGKGKFPSDIAIWPLGEDGPRVSYSLQTVQIDENSSTSRSLRKLLGR